MQYTSRPVPAVREDSSHLTLGDTLNELLPEYFEARAADNSNIGETASVSAGASGSPQNSRSQVCLLKEVLSASHRRERILRNSKVPGAAHPLSP